MGITVLGPLTVDGSGHVGPRDRVVLAALAVRPGQPVSTDQLAAALWGDSPPASAAKILQGCVMRLRKVLGGDAIETLAHGYLLAVPPDQLDSLRFERLVVRARELLGLGEADRAAYQLSEALTLWRGAAFADLEEWAPAASEARRLGELRLEAEELRVDALLRAGRHREVLAEVQSLVRAAPLRERRWVLQAHAQYQAGNQGEALRTLHRLKSVLTTQLGVDPGPDVAVLEQAILRQDPSLLSRGSILPTSATCPYQGLQAFDVDDADRFFGRERDVDACLEVLRRTTLLVLVGPSGSGKSSLLRAGLGATLRARGTPTVTITPGPRPLDSLTALTGSPAGAALLVDQFDEVFTLCDDVSAQREFLEAVVTASGVRSVAVAVRADHLGDVSAHPGLARLVEQGLYLVGGLDKEGLTEAVEAPARQAGLVVEPGLVDLLVREVEDEPGALPLLSHVLLETWRRREGNTLTVAGYRASGGIHGAVAQSAELLYSRIEVERRHLLRDLLLRLVTPGVRGEPVRSRVPRRQVATDGERDRLIELLVGARLVTSDDGVLEITHEALARAWPRLRGWLDDDVEGQRMLHHLSAAADAWDSMDRPDSELYRGVRLARIRDWQAGSTTTLTDTEQAFLVASQQHAELKERSAEEYARVQARLIRRLRGVLTGAVVLLVLALAAGGVAAVQSERAGDNAGHAVTAEASAKQQALAAQVRGAGLRSNASSDVDESLLLALSAVGIDDSPEAVGILTQALSRNPGLIRSTPLDAEDVLAIDLAPDDRHLATIDGRHHVRLVDERTGAVVAEMQAGAARTEVDDFRALRFSPDGRTLAIGRTPLARRPVALVDGDTLAAIQPRLTGLPGVGWRTVDVAFSGDGTALAAALQRTRVRGVAREVSSLWAAVWRLDRPGDPVLRRLPRGNVDWASVALSPAGDRLYVLPSGLVYDLGSGARGEAFFPHALKRGTGIEVSPDGRMLAFGVGTLRGAVVLDVRSGRVVHRLSTDVSVSDVRFSRDGSRLLTTHWEPRTTRVWDVGSGRLVSDMLLPDGSEQAVDLDRSGDTVVSADPDGTVRRWDVTGRRRYLRRIPLHGFPDGFVEAGGSCFTTPQPGGAYVAYLPCGFGSDLLTYSYLMLDVARRRVRLIPDAVSGWAYGDGSWRAGTPSFTVPDGEALKEFDARLTRLLRTSGPLGGVVTDVDHSPDGSAVAASEAAGRVVLLDAETFEAVGVPVDVGVPVAGVSLGPDDRTAVVMTGGPDLSNFWDAPITGWALVDLERGEIIRDGHLDFDVNWARYSPDGKHAAFSDVASGNVLIIDVRTGEPVRPAVRAHGGPAFWMTFSADGSRLLSAADDGTVVLWDTDTAVPLARVTIPVPSLVSAEFRPDGTILIVPWGPDPAVYVWDPSPERAVAFGCRAVARDLTEAEWRESFGTRPYQDACPDS